MAISATLRRTVGTTATSLSLPYPSASITGGQYYRTYKVYNNSATIAYVAEATTGGGDIVAGNNILSVCSDYLTIPANSSRIFTSNIPSTTFGQSASGTVALDFVPLW